MTRSAAWLLCLLLLGCDSEGEAGCTRSDECPPGVGCVMGRCSALADGAPGDAPVVDASPVADARPDRGPAQDAAQDAQPSDSAGGGDGGEDSGWVCAPGAERSCQGAPRCPVGIQRCEDGRWSTCRDPLDPRPEICNGVDDDCDGEIDEPEPAPAACGVGECRRSAVESCEDGERICLGGEPSAERCDGLDNDCDGAIDELLRPLPPVPFTPPEADARGPAIARTAEGFAVAWIDLRARGEVYFQRLDAAGEPIGGEVQISVAADGEASSPTLVWNGRDYGIAWLDSRVDAPGLYFVRLDELGAAQAPPTRLLNRETLPLQLFWTGQSFGLVFGERVDRLQANIYLLGLRGADPQIIASPNLLGSYSIVFAHGQLALAYASESGTTLRRFSPQGELNGSVDIGDGLHQFPKVVATEAGFAVAQQRRLENQLVLTRISAEGLIVGRDVLTREFPGGPMSLAWTGFEFGVVWPAGSIQMLRATALGQPLGPPFALAIGDAPALLGGPGGYFLVFAQRGQLSTQGLPLDCP